MHLRPYQQQAADAVLREFASGHQATAVVMPTGCGKTVLFATLAALTEENHGGDEWLVGVGFETGESPDPGTSPGTDLSGGGQDQLRHGELPGNRDGGAASESAHSGGSFACRSLFDTDTDFGPDLQELQREWE